MQDWIANDRDMFSWSLATATHLHAKAHTTAKNTIDRASDQIKAKINNRQKAQRKYLNKQDLTNE